MSNPKTPATALRLIEELACKRRQYEAAVKADRQAEDEKKLQDMFLYWKPITDILDAFVSAHPDRLKVYKPNSVWRGYISFQPVKSGVRHALQRLQGGCRITPQDERKTPADFIPYVIDVLADALK